MRILIAVLAVGAAAAPARAQEHAGCPMKRPDSTRQAEVDHRHQHATGLPSAGTRHQFLVAEDGGSIRLEALDASDRETRDAVRAHLRHIASAFAAGDFSMPVQIHDQLPPGAETMKARRASIRYSYTATPAGGLVSIATRDREALTAVHDFLRFQIRDHGTEE